MYISEKLLRDLYEEDLYTRTLIHVREFNNIKRMTDALGQRH